MRNPTGFTEIISPGERTMEIDAPPCKHCGFIMFMKPGFRTTPVTLILRGDGTQYEKEAGYCRRCQGYICPRCDGKECYPYHMRIEDEEKAARKFICT